MSDPDIDPTIGAPADVPPMSNEEAAEIVQEDDALQAAGSDSDDEDA